MTTIAGLYSRALLTDVNPVMAFPMLGEKVLPPFYLGLFIVGLLATVMSTLDSTIFLSAVTFGRDLLWRIRRKSNLTKYTKIGMVISLLFSTILVVLLPSVVKMWYTIGSVVIPALILPVLITFSKIRKYFNDTTMMSSIFLSFITSVIWLVIGVNLGTLDLPNYLFNLQPFYVGLGVSSVIILGGFVVNR